MTGVVLAFKKYNYNGGIYFSPWNGLNNFKALMISGKLGMVTRNTILYNIIFISLGVVLEMGSAILLNELRCKIFKKTAQSFMFLPYFISWVVAGAIVYNILVSNAVLQIIFLQVLEQNLLIYTTLPAHGRFC